MIRAISRACPGILAAAGLLLSACTARLAPGYFIEHEEVELYYTAAVADRLHVRASYRLKNVGNAPLASMRVYVPTPQAGGRQDLRATFDGQPATVQEISQDGRPAVRLGISPSWPEDKKRQLVLEYELSLAALGAGPRATLHLEAAEWFPELITPEGLFAYGKARAEQVRVRIRAPQGYRVQASGYVPGQRRRGAEVEYRYDLHRKLFNPFLVLGQYHEREIDSRGVVVKFWTLEPLEEAAARRAGQRLAATLNIYLGLLGPVWQGTKTFWVVEAARELPVPAGSAARVPGLGFPSGALIGRDLFARGVDSEEFLEFTEARLARTWFGRLAEPDPDVGITLARALVEYAGLLAEEWREGTAERERNVAARMALYRQSAADTEEKPVAFIRAGDSRDDQELAVHKAVLFLIALEERVTPQHLHAAVRRMVQAMRGDTYGWNELRSAIEGESEQKLGEFFRQWLNQTGIPEEFSQRHAAAAQPD